MNKKIKSILAAAMLLLASAAANASMGCQLFVTSQYSPYPSGAAWIFPGETFSFQITIGQQIFPGPWDPGYFVNDYTITFYGSRDGVPDIPGGEGYPGNYQQGTFALTGFGNPGGVAGTYQRYAVVRYASGSHAGEGYCTTDPVTLYLL